MNPRDPSMWARHALIDEVERLRATVSALESRLKTRMPRHHHLKTWRDPFAALLDGSKRFEFRRDDRGFQVGDILVLREWDHEMLLYTGREFFAQVTYVLREEPGAVAFGVPEGYCVMSIVPVLWREGSSHPPAAGE